MFDRLNIAIDDREMRAKCGLEGDDAIHHWTFLRILLDFSVRDGESIIVLMPHTMFTREALTPQPVYVVKVDELTNKGTVEEIGKLPPAYFVSKFHFEVQSDNTLAINLEGTGGRGKEKISAIVRREPSVMPWEVK